MASIHSKIHGIEIYVRNNMKDAHILHHSDSNGTQTICIYVADLKIENIYKPSNNKWLINILIFYDHPTLYIGNFNSHH